MSKLGSNNETDSFDKFFSDTLKDASMQPSAEVWQHIEDSLNQDKRRKRGFIWLIFCGLIFIGAGISTYVLLNDKVNAETTKTSNVKEPKSEIKNNTTIATKKELLIETTNKENTAKENTANADLAAITKPEEKEINPTESAAAENTVKEEKANTIRIQLGAFKKQIDKSIFDKTGLNIKSETNEAGVTRYYAEVPENEKQKTLQKVQQAGFADAFVRGNTLLAAKNDEVKNVRRNNKTTQNTSGILVAKNNEVKNETATNLNMVAATKHGVAKTKNTNTTTQTKNTNLPLANDANTTKNETDKNENVKNTIDEPKQMPVNEIATANTNTLSANNKQPEETKTEPVVVKQDEVVAEKTDSVMKPDTEIASINKTDSVKTEDKKKDTAQVAKTEEPPVVEKMSRWALLLTGGPNFFIKNTNNILVNTSGETQPTAYNGSLKVEYRLLKKIAISAGLNYSYFTAQQDATFFYFNKNQTTDFIFYSSYGPMAVDMPTMLQDFSPAAPVTMFHAYYSYTSKLNTLAVPIEAKWYFVNGKRINLYTALGASAMFVISEQTKLAVIKEHLTNNITYNQINTAKFNALLMLGLGGDVKLYKKLYFTVDGGFKYGATNLSTTSGIKTNPTYFSVNGGLKIKF